MMRMKTGVVSRWLNVWDRSVLKLGSLELRCLGLDGQLKEEDAQYRCGRQCTPNLHQAILLAVEATHRNLPAKRGYGGLRSSNGAEKSRGTMGGIGSIVHRWREQNGGLGWGIALGAFVFWASSVRFRGLKFCSSYTASRADDCHLH